MSGLNQEQLEAWAELSDIPVEEYNKAVSVVEGKLEEFSKDLPKLLLHAMKTDNSGEVMQQGALILMKLGSCMSAHHNACSVLNGEKNSGVPDSDQEPSGEPDAPNGIETQALRYIEAHEAVATATAELKKLKETKKAAEDLLVETFAESEIERIRVQDRTISPRRSLQVSVLAKDRGAVKELCQELELDGVITDSCSTPTLKRYVNEWVDSPIPRDNTPAAIRVLASGPDGTDVDDWLFDGAPEDNIPISVATLAKENKVVEEWVEDNYRAIPQKLRPLVNIFQETKIGMVKS